MSHEEEMPCFCCGKSLDNFDWPEGNQPLGGTEFTTRGHYGSAVTDHMDGTGYAINVCDPCLKVGGRKGRVLQFRPHSQPRPRVIYSRWDP